MSMVVDESVVGILLKELKILKSDYAKMRMELGLGKLPDTSKIRKVRNEIARKFTYLNQAGAYEAFQGKVVGDKKK